MPDSPAPPNDDVAAASSLELTRRLEAVTSAMRRSRLGSLAIVLGGFVTTGLLILCLQGNLMPVLVAPGPIAMIVGVVVAIQGNLDRIRAIAELSEFAKSLEQPATQTPPEK